MDYLTLIDGLVQRYPYTLMFPFKRTSSLDGNYDQPIIVKTLEDAYEIAQKYDGGFNDLFKYKINLSLEEIKSATFPITAIESVDFGIIQYVIIDRTTPKHLSALLPEANTSMHIVLTGNDNVMKYFSTLEYRHRSCASLYHDRDHIIRCAHCTQSLTEPTLLESGDIVMYEKDTTAYFSAVIARPNSRLWRILRPTIKSRSVQ